MTLRCATECLNCNDCINDLQNYSILASRIADTDGHGVGDDVMIDLMLLVWLVASFCVSTKRHLLSWRFCSHLMPIYGNISQYMCSHNANRCSCHLIFIAFGRSNMLRKLFGIFSIFDALYSCGGVVWNAVMFATKFIVFKVPPTGSGLFGTKLVMRELLTHELRAFEHTSLAISSHYLQIHCLYHRKNIYSNSSVVYDSG